MLDEARDARGEHAGLARAGAGEHEQRPFEVLDRFALRGVQTASECRASELQKSSGKYNLERRAAVDGTSSSRPP